MAAAKKKLTVKMQLLPHARDLALPPPSDDDHVVGLALVAAVPADVPMVLAPGQRAAIPTGLVIALPQGTEAQVSPRPGLALQHGVTVLAAPQTVPASYRGEVHVIMINLGREPFAVERGAAIALLVFVPVVTVNVEWPREPGATAP